MNRPYILLLFVFFTAAPFKAIGQENLVPNPSFEIITDCPDDFFSAAIELSVGWFSALGTPEIYNACAPPHFGGVPINGEVCYQNARTGVGYAGLLPYLTIPRTTEYMEVKLEKKLTAGKRYYISFFVSPRNCTGHDECYSDIIGLAFSNFFYQEVFNSTIEQIPPFIPAIKNPGGNVIKDTLNWTEVSGCYIADGTEQYAIIGSFTSSSVMQNESCIGGTGSYYLFDDVGVYEFTALPDTVILCDGEMREIGPPFLDAKYQWSTGAATSSIQISKEGRYIRSTIMRNCTVYDTVTVLEMNRLVAGFPVDTLICEGEILKINIPVPGIYTWSTGANSSEVWVKNAGLYSFSMENHCGIFNHFFEISTETCNCNVYVPNAFSPEGDNPENNFLPCFVHCDFLFRPVRFQVFDRWGNLVYLNDSPDYQTIKWDGKTQGKVLNPGVYFWSFQYEYSRNGIVHSNIKNGDVTIVK